MTDIAFSSAKPSFSPLRLQERSLGWQAGAVVLGTLFLALSSYIQVPMVPVPVTMQTFAVTLVGALYGWRLGAITIAAWLAEGAVWPAGLPAYNISLARRAAISSPSRLSAHWSAGWRSAAGTAAGSCLPLPPCCSATCCA